MIGGTFEVRMGKRPFFRASMQMQDKDLQQRRAEGGNRLQGVLRGVWLEVSVVEVDASVEKSGGSKDQARQSDGSKDRAWKSDSSKDQPWNSGGSGWQRSSGSTWSAPASSAGTSKASGCGGGGDDDKDDDAWGEWSAKGEKRLPEQASGGGDGDEGDEDDDAWAEWSAEKRQPEQVVQAHTGVEWSRWKRCCSSLADGG